MTDSRANPSVIVAGARTPVGRLLGSLSGFTGAQLGGVAIKGALEKAGVRGDQVDYVIMGQVLTAGAGQMPARQAATAAGLLGAQVALVGIRPEVAQTLVTLGVGLEAMTPYADLQEAVRAFGRPARSTAAA